MDKISVRIKDEVDIYFIQDEVLKILNPIGFNLVEVNKVKTIVSELAFNIIKYAEKGFIRVTRIEDRGKIGIQIIAVDRGSGISNIEEAMKDNFSSSGTLGLGLPGIKRMADYLKVNSSPSEGTEVIVKCWKEL